MADERQLPGYEEDINYLIDTYALLAHQEQVLSFQTFKRLFKDGCFAYIHQAYWGCEHSPEYAQLLFAVALDRLDIPSPTAPPESALWQLHQLMPKNSAGAAAGVCSMEPAQPDSHLEAAAAAAAAAAGEAGQFEAAEAMEVDQQELQPTQQSDGPQLARFEAAAAGPQISQQAGHGQHFLQQAGPLHALQQSMESAPMAGPINPGSGTPLLQHAQPQQQPGGSHMQSEEGFGLVQLAAQQQQLLQQQQQPWPIQGMEQQQQPAQQQQQQQDHAALQQPSDDWICSPLLLPQPTPQQGEPMPQLSPSDPVWQLMSPLMSPLQQQGSGPGARAGLDGLEGFMLPSAAIAPAGQIQQQQQQQQLEQQVQQQQQQHQAHAADAAQLPQPSPPQQLLQQQQQQQQQQQGVLAQVDEEEDFLSDLLAILDEGMQSQEQYGGAAADAASAPGGAAQEAAATGAGTAADAVQQQQQMVLQIPLVVKGAAVFVVLALHESQLNYPKTPVYVPLPLLQQLAAAAAEFRAAGAAAADALQAVQVLVQQQRLLVGQFRRPSPWQPQLPAYLMPGGRLPGGLGLNTAIGAAARKAARTAAKSAMQSAAVAAAARAARGAAAFDPGVHREAVFHIKTALRGLSNFKSLQSLCDEYANARKAVFEPLLGSAQQGAAAAAQLGMGSAQHQQQQQEAEAEAEAEQVEEPAGQGALVVKRGGSRRKRRAAIATAGTSAAAAAANVNSIDGGRALAAAGAAAVPPATQQPAAAAAAAAGGVDLPELFDISFASNLQGLANGEASRMLLLLDPYYSASKVRKRTAEEKRAAKAAEAAAAAEAQGRLNRFKSLTMARAGAEGSAAGLPRQQPSRSAPAASGMQDMRQELVAAGVIAQQDWEDGGHSLGPGMDISLSGGAQQVLRRAAQQRQTAVEVAQEWLRAQNALVVVDEDMP